MSEFDLIIRGGSVADGSGLPRYRADVGVKDGRITAVGRLRGRARRVIDAEGRVVTPGFIDGHTHMDAQLFWNPLGTCSSWHGVTTVVMGNCGFTLAPARADARELVVRNLEKAEDIAPEAIAAGVDWSWEGYDGFLDAVEAAPKAINYAGYVGHSALRTWAMGERAFDGPATDDDLEVMRTELRRALAAGALGMSTSRSITHTTSDDRPVASRQADWSEIEQLCDVLAGTGRGRIFQISVSDEASSEDPQVRARTFGQLRDLAVNRGVPVTFGIINSGDPYRASGLFDTIDAASAAGGRMWGQTLPREATIILSFTSRLPYDRLPEWAELRAEPLDKQRSLLEDPLLRERLVRAANEGTYTNGVGATVRPPDYERIRVIEDPVGPNPTLAEVAARRGVSPVEALIDLCRERDLNQYFTQAVGNVDEEEVRRMLHHPRSIPTFSDSGAHVGYILESSIQTYLLAYWVRKRQELSLEEAVRMLTLAPATAWGFADRGLVREGMVADLNVLDPDIVGPGPLGFAHDLPTGAFRFTQQAVGIDATVVGGEITLESGEHTDARPGRLLRAR